MHKPRYVVVNHEGEWLIKQAGRHFSDSYASKAQALYAAIEFAERDGNDGHFAEVLVREGRASGKSDTTVGDTAT
jgi:hypothetical protein